jgi:CO/xanthine dehydrogenase FAD-binding subunit
MVEVNDGRRDPVRVLAVARLPELQGIRIEGRELVIGAACTYTELMGEPVRTAAPALAYASRTVGSPQIRNAGTIGGNLGTASPAGDTLPVLVALDARVHVASASDPNATPCSPGS